VLLGDRILRGSEPTHLSVSRPYARRVWFDRLTARIDSLGLPPAVEYILTTTNQLRCLAVGINGNYFVSGVNKKGQVFYG